MEKIHQKTDVKKIILSNILSQPKPSKNPSKAKLGLGLNSVMRQNPPPHKL